MKKEELEKIYRNLCEMGEIKHNHVIDREILGNCFDTSNYETWDYISPFLEFKSYLEQEIGMFCTSNQGDLCIASLNDAAEHSKIRRKRSENLDKRTKKTLERLDYRAMSSTARTEAMLEKRMLEMKLRNSRLIMREIEYYEVPASVDEEE